MSKEQSQPVITEQNLNDRRYDLIQNQRNRSSQTQTSGSKNNFSYSQNPLIPNTNQADFTKNEIVQDKMQINEDKFFQVMDLVDDYDLLLKQMNQLYTDGMMGIANVKFSNPYTSLSTKGFKPTPAIMKVCIDQGKLSKINDKDNKQSQISQLDNQDYIKFSLVQQKKVWFTYSVLDQIGKQDKDRNNSNDQINDQNEDESQQPINSSMSTAHNLYADDQQQLALQEEEIIDQCRDLYKKQDFSKQEFILGRFNIESQKPMILQSMDKFNALLSKLLEIAQKKITIEKLIKNQTNQ